MHIAAGSSNNPVAPQTTTFDPTSGGMIESLTPTLSATYRNNASGPTGHVDFEVYTAGNKLLATGSGPTGSGAAQPGQTSSWTYSGPALQVGDTYEVKAQSDSNGVTSGYGPETPFQIDPRMAWGLAPWMTNISLAPAPSTSANVDVANGELNVGVNLLSVPAGVNLPVDLNFTQTSSQNASSEGSERLAYDWVDTLSEHVGVSPDGQSVSYYAPDGSVHTFTSNGSGGWNRPGGFNGTLTKISSGLASRLQHRRCHPWRRTTGPVQHRR